MVAVCPCGCVIVSPIEVTDAVGVRNKVRLLLVAESIVFIRRHIRRYVGNDTDSGGTVDGKNGASPVSAPRKRKAASNAGGQMSSEAAVAYYFFIAEPWAATHCHFPSGIFTQVSV